MTRRSHSDDSMDAWPGQHMGRTEGEKVNGDELADLAAELLKEMIRIGDTTPSRPKASRLGNPYAPRLRNPSRYLKKLSTS
jgi:hypothetical protein